MQTPIIILFPLLGILGGIILKTTAKEEIKPGKPYFSWLRRLLATLLALLLLIETLPFAWGILIGMALGILLRTFLKLPLLFLGLATTLATALPSAIAQPIAALAFLYLLPHQTQASSSPKYIVSQLVLYLLPALLLALPQTISMVHHPFLLALGAGALMGRA